MDLGMASAKRDHLIDTAVDLFYRNGFHATGVDRILDVAGVARMTLYNHFRSKDELIIAALRRRDEQFRNWFMRAVESRAAEPSQRLHLLFNVLQDWFTEKGFSGCMFINASAEFSDRDHPVHKVAAEHKMLMLRYLRELTRTAGVADSDQLAEELMLLMEGAIVMAYVTGDRNAAANAARAAARLIGPTAPQIN
jgi:AcrR family transcriptional regulator